MKKPPGTVVTEKDREIDGAISFFERLQGIRHTNESKLRVLNSLLRAEAKIQVEKRELAVR